MRPSRGPWPGRHDIDVSKKIIGRPRPFRIIVFKLTFQVFVSRFLVNDLLVAIVYNHTKLK